MKSLKNILKVILGNVTTILSGIFVSFLLPKILTVSDYGYYKIFTLYYNYLGVLSLGIIDGIVLRYGEKDYDGLERERFRSYFLWYFILHSVISVTMALGSIFVGGADYRYVLLLLSANLIPANVTGYLQQISQITQRFQEYSVRKILQSVANIALVGVLFVLFKTNVAEVTYQLYLAGLLAINVVLVLWYIVTYKDIIFGKHTSLAASFREVLSLIKLGFPLLLANLCSTLLLSLDRQLVSMFFTTEEYAVYAFAYSMLSLITVATSAVSIVIYPIFKRVELQRLKENYSLINSVLLIFLFLGMTVYFPLKSFVGWFLPQYTYSIGIFRIILPGLAVSASITVVIHNYYKVFGKTTLFFKKSIVALVVSLLFNLTAYYLFGTREAISLSSVAALLVWLLDSQRGLRSVLKINGKTTFYLFLVGSLFYLSSMLPSTLWGGFLYFLGTLLITALFFYRDRSALKALIKV